MGAYLRQIASRMNSGISRDDWLKALAESQPDLTENDPSALTVAEFATLFSITRNTAQKRLSLLETAGRATPTTKVGRGSDGRLFRSAAYRLTP